MKATTSSKNMPLQIVSKIQLSLKTMIFHLSVWDSKLGFVGRGIADLLSLDSYHPASALLHPKYSPFRIDCLASSIAATQNGIYVSTLREIFLFSLDSQFSRHVCSLNQTNKGFAWNSLTESLCIGTDTKILITNEWGKSIRCFEIGVRPGFGEISIHNNLIYVPSEKNSTVMVYSLEGSFVRSWKTEISYLQDLCIYKENLVLLGSDEIEFCNLEGKNRKTLQVPSFDSFSCTANENTLFIGGKGEIYCFKECKGSSL